MEWIDAPDIKKEIDYLIKSLEMSYVNPDRIICFRSHGSVAHARARIWSFPRIWQLALKLPPCYIIEVISKHFDHLSPDEKKRTLIHELMHIPKTFSGSLVPHKTRYKRINPRSVEKLFRQLF